MIYNNTDKLLNIENGIVDGPASKFLHEYEEDNENDENMKEIVKNINNYLKISIIINSLSLVIMIIIVILYAFNAM